MPEKISTCSDQSTLDIMPNTSQIPVDTTEVIVNDDSESDVNCDSFPESKSLSWEKFCDAIKVISYFAKCVFTITKDGGKISVVLPPPPLLH